MNENIGNTPSKRRKFFKQKARSILYRDWFTRMLAFLMAGGIYYGTVQFGASVSILFAYLVNSEYLSELWFAIFLVFAALFLIPLIPGMINFEICAQKNGKSSISDMFYAYENVDELMRSYRMVMYAFIKVILFYVPSLAVKLFLDVIYVPGFFGVRLSLLGKDGVFFIISAVYVVLTFAAVVFSTKAVMGLYVCIKRKDEKISNCFFTAGICLRAQKWEMTKLVLSFAPLCLLSLFTVGLLFVMYTVPYMIITVTMYCGYLYDREMLSKNTLNVLYPQEQNNENVE